MIELCCKYLSVRYIWLYVIVMSRTCFRVNPHSIVAWMSRNSLLKQVQNLKFKSLKLHILRLLRIKIKNLNSQIKIWICRIWYHLYNFKNVKNTHKGVLPLVKWQPLVCNFTKHNAPPLEFSGFFVLCNRAQRNTSKTPKLLYFEQSPQKWAFL